MFPDFFDADVKPTDQAESVNTVENEDETEKEQTMAEKLPEGFFDNPKLDAKVLFYAHEAT